MTSKGTFTIAACLVGSVTAFAQSQPPRLSPHRRTHQPVPGGTGRPGL